MDVQYVLLSPRGRIAPRTFLRGLILLTAGYMFVQIAGTYLSPGFQILGWPMIYMYACVFSKRLHDAGQSGWFYLAFLIGFVVIGNIVSVVLMPALSPAAYALSAEAQQIMVESGMAAGINFISERAAELAQKSALTTLASFLITTACLATIGARLPSDPNANRYGPPPARGPAPTLH